MTSRKCKCWDCISPLNRREEIRHGGVTEEELPRGPKKKKNTRKWCKGKVGVKHAWTRKKPYDWTDTEAEVCDNCGKYGKFYWSFQT